MVVRNAVIVRVARSYILAITVILHLFLFYRVERSVYRVSTLFIPKHAQICFKFKGGGTL